MRNLFLMLFALTFVTNCSLQSEESQNLENTTNSEAPKPEISEPEVPETEAPKPEVSEQEILNQKFLAKVTGKYAHKRSLIMFKYTYRYLGGSFKNNGDIHDVISSRRSTFIKALSENKALYHHYPSTGSTQLELTVLGSDRIDSLTLEYKVLHSGLKETWVLNNSSTQLPPKSQMAWG